MLQYIYVGLFSFVGASLGFWSLRYQEGTDGVKLALEYLRSVLTGIFSALIIYAFCVEKFGEGHVMGMMVSGGVAFGGTDAAIAIYQKIIRVIKGKDDE